MLLAPNATTQSGFFFISAAIALASLAATNNASAQEITEPGNFAFFYPNGDLGLGYSKPADAMASQPPRSGELSTMRMSVKPHRAIRAPAIKHY